MQYSLETIRNWLAFGGIFAGGLTIIGTTMTIEHIMKKNAKRATCYGAMAALGLVLLAFIFTLVIINAIFYAAGSVC